MVVITTTSLNLLLLILFPILDPPEAQITYIQTRLTLAQMEESAQIHLALPDFNSLNKAVEDLEDNSTSPTLMADSRSMGDANSNLKPKEGDDLAPVELNILHKHDELEPLAKPCSGLGTQRLHHCG